MKLSIFRILLVLFCVAEGNILCSVKSECKNVKAVYALTDIPSKQMIQEDEVAERKISSNEIPMGISSDRDWHERANAGYEMLPRRCFLSLKKQVVGRLSLGISKGDLLYTWPPGFRGTTIVCANQDIPYGEAVKSVEIVEMSANPRDIPIRAIPSKSEALSRVSVGIKRGEILSYASEKFSGRGVGGVSMPVHKAERDVVYATVRIRNGAVIRSGDVVLKRTDGYEFPPDAISDIGIAVGHRVKTKKEIGQILLRSDFSN